jgi:hypothetical protein
MTRPSEDELVARMIADECSHGDCELAHARADELVIQLLRKLGYGKTVAAWENVDKWYA